ncbi:MAG: hypothetical protein K6G22_14925 [Lachnospiraceae bacterium]|nr:hypothetical protein [Lachnospiraceae bacterium]
MKKVTGGMNVGTSSVLSAFVILCLVTFAGLSFLSANTDNLLSRQSAAKTKEYYNTCADADTRLAELEKDLKDIAKESSDESDYFKKISDRYSSDKFYEYSEEDDEKTISYILSVNERQNLHVKIKLNYPGLGNYSVFDVDTYRVEANPDWKDTSDDGTGNGSGLMTFD